MATLEGVWLTGANGGRYVICIQCGRTGSYDPTYDSAYCGKCLVWLERQCSCDPESGCPFVGRPESPTRDY